MGVPIADQNTELSSSSRRNNAPFLQQSGIRPCINVMAACVDLEDVKPMPVEGTANEKNHHHSGVVPAVHYSHRAPWLRALVLGANDGLVSIASLMMGVEAFHNAARSSGHPSAVSGLAGLVAGACSMAIGEYVSVFSQRDSQLADLEIERQVRVLLPSNSLHQTERLWQLRWDSTSLSIPNCAFQQHNQFASSVVECLHVDHRSKFSSLDKVSVLQCEKELDGIYI